jgi:V-type ATPase 116kDa subunit family
MNSRAIAHANLVCSISSFLHLCACILFAKQAMLSAIKTNNPVAVFIGFAIFFSVTFGVLLCMDVLECFLHALRLHWVRLLLLLTVTKATITLLLLKTSGRKTDAYVSLLRSGSCLSHSVACCVCEHVYAHSAASDTLCTHLLMY